MSDVADCRGIVSPDCPAVSQIVDSLDEIQYLTELNDADIGSVQSIFEDRSLHALLSVGITFVSESILICKLVQQYTNSYVQFFAVEQNAKKIN